MLSCYNKKPADVDDVSYTAGFVENCHIINLWKTENLWYY